jgi:galactokinase
VPKGSGLSSSAAFEVLVATMLDELWNGGKLTPVERAKIGQYAENHYFGKPSGLMDQCGCSVGGFMAIDFRRPAKARCHPDRPRFRSDRARAGYHEHRRQPCRSDCRLRLDSPRI